ncbi:MAG: hypothetical protein ACR2FU_10310 [Streptosporangiaceae bacterium]
MSLYVLCSPGGSPGVTTTALALALTWTPPVLLAECDPAGGAILAGLFAGHLPAPRGLLGAAFDAGIGATALSAGPGGQLAALDSTGGRAFLAGLSDPRQAPGLAPAWPAVARALAAQQADVLADCGRLDAADTQPIAVLADADLAVLVLRPTLRQIAAAGPRIEMLAQLRGDTERIGLLLIGDHGHRPAEIAKTLGVAVLATLPSDPRTAAVLSDGVGRRASLTDRPLMRAAKIAVRAVLAATAAPPLAGSPLPSRRTGTGDQASSHEPAASGASPRASGFAKSDGLTISGLGASGDGLSAASGLGDPGGSYRLTDYASGRGVNGYGGPNGDGGANWPPS